MLKKLFFLIVMFLIVIPMVSAEQEEKSLWDSFVNWIKDLFGISNEEAEKIAKDFLTDFEKDTWAVKKENKIYSPYGWREINEDRATVSFQLAENVLGGYVKRGDDVIKTKEADSLTEEDLYGIEIKYNKDENTPFDIEKINFTDGKLKVYLKDIGVSEDNLNKNIPLKVIGKDKDRNLINKIEKEKNIKSIDNKQSEIIDYEIGDVIKYGFASTSFSMTLNTTNGTFKDTTTCDGGSATYNFGGTKFTVLSGSNCNLHQELNTTYFFGADIEFSSLNITYYTYEHSAGGGNKKVYSQYEDWIEGSGIGTSAGICSWNANNDSIDGGWTGGTRSQGSELGTFSIDGTGQDTLNLSNLTGVNDLISYRGVLRTMILTSSPDDFRTYSREGATPPVYSGTYEVIANNPTEPVPILNSTTTDQMNYTNETLACNFLCDDADVADTLTYDISWYSNGVPQFGFSGISCSNPEYVTEFLESDNITAGGLWGCSVNVTDNTGRNSSTVFSNNVTVREYLVTSPPGNLTITYPSPNNNTITINNTHEFNCTADCDVPTNNIIYYEYYADRDEVPTTLVANTTDSSGLITLEDGNYFWRCRATTNYSDSSNYSEIRNLFIDNSSVKEIIYYTETQSYETLKNNYNLTIQAGNLSVSDIDVVFSYNNQDYTLTKTITEETFDNTTYLFNYDNLVTPLSKTSVDVLWNSTITLRNGTILNEEKTFTQDIAPIQFDLCNETLTQDYLNITFLDEEDNTVLNASIPTSTFYYSLSSDNNLNKSLSFVNTTENFGYEFCFDPPNKTLYLSMSIGYESTNYPQRNIQKNSSYTNTITTETLYLLKTPSGIYSTFQVVSPANQVIENVYSLVERSIGGTYKFIEEGYTDSAGAITFFLNSDYTYRLTFSKTGYDTSVLTIKPTPIYTVTLGEEATTDIEDYNKGVTYDIGPANDVIGNETTYVFTFNISSDYWSLTESGFVLSNSSGTVIGSDSCTTASGCISSLSANTENNTGIVMNYYWVVYDNDEYNYLNGTKAWYVLKSGTRKSSITMFMEDVEKLGSGFSDFTKAIISFFIIFFTVGIMSYYSGIYSPLAILGEIFFITLLLDMVKMIPEVSTRITGAIPHFITVMIGLLFLGYAIFEYTKSGGGA
jgi:hypothetical protein